MKVLIIDDDPQVRQALRDTLEEAGGWDVADQAFDGLGDALLRLRPDMVVLDLVDGQPSDERIAGNTSFDDIRKTWFCPVVVYSAFPEKREFNHLLTTTIKKGANNDLKVLDGLMQFVPDAKMIQDVHRDFDARVREALRDSVQALREQIDSSDEGAIGSVVPRAIRRLVAARVDFGSAGEGKLRAWERFVVPPLGDHLLTADLLRQKNSPWNDAEAFRLVLTPSCDLVAQSVDGDLATEQVLVARCEPMRRLGTIEMCPGTTLNSKKRSRLTPIINEGMTNNYFPIPQFKGQIPVMVANLKRLDLIPWNKIQSKQPEGQEIGADFEYQRVASTDSPFREMVVWAYLRVTGRPGVPPIDVERWIEDISESLIAEVET